MDNLFQFRNTIVSYFKKYESLILLFTKFIITFFVISSITEMNLFSPMVSRYISNTRLLAVNLIFTVLSLLVPTSLTYMILGFVICLSVSKSIEVAIIIFVFLLLLFLFYVHMANVECHFIILTILAFYFKVPYLVPIIAGLYFGITTSVPISVGIFIWRAIPAVLETIDVNTSSVSGVSDLLSVPQKILPVLSFMSKKILENQLWICESAIFFMIIVLVFIVSRIRIEHAKDIAIVLGGMLNVVGFAIAIANLSLNISLSLVILSTIVCVCIGIIISFFDVILDFARVENVEFSDETHYYYVKVVPKVTSVKSTEVKTQAKPVNTETLLARKAALEKKQNETKSEEKKLNKEKADKLIEKIDDKNSSSENKKIREVPLTEKESLTKETPKESAKKISKETPLYIKKDEKKNNAKKAGNKKSINELFQAAMVKFFGEPLTDEEKRKLEKLKEREKIDKQVKKAEKSKQHAEEKKIREEKKKQEQLKKQEDAKKKEESKKKEDAKKATEAKKKEELKKKEDAKKSEKKKETKKEETKKDNEKSKDNEKKATSKENKKEEKPKESEEYLTKVEETKADDKK